MFLNTLLLWVYFNLLLAALCPLCGERQGTNHQINKQTWALTVRPETEGLCPLLHLVPPLDTAMDI